MSSEQNMDKDLLPLVYNPKLMEDEEEAIRAFFIRNRHGPLAVITCGDDCLYGNACPYKNLHKEPVGRPCALELQFAAMWLSEYAQEFKLSMEAAADNNMVRELILWQVMEMRYHYEYASNPKTAERICKGFDPDGVPIVDLKLNPAIKAMKEASARKAVLFKNLLATRLDKSKAVSKESDDENKGIAKLMAKYQVALEEQRKKTKLLKERGAKEVIDGEFKVED